MIRYATPLLALVFFHTGAEAPAPAPTPEHIYAEVARSSIGEGGFSADAHRFYHIRRYQPAWLEGN